MQNDTFTPSEGQLLLTFNGIMEVDRVTRTRAYVVERTTLETRCLVERMPGLECYKGGLPRYGGKGAWFDLDDEGNLARWSSRRFGVVPLPSSPVLLRELLDRVGNAAREASCMIDEMESQTKELKLAMRATLSDMLDCETITSVA